MVRDAP
jgi:hypothetical protein